MGRLISKYGYFTKPGASGRDAGSIYMNGRIVVLALMMFFLPGCKNSRTPPANKLKTEKEVHADTLDRAVLTIFRTLDKKEILRRLFDNFPLDSQGMSVWKGNYADLTSLSIPLSYDGKFHTSLDTILYFVDTKNRNCAVAIFSTYDFQRDAFDSTIIRPTGCHFCGVPIGVALFHQTEEKSWQLYDFKKEISQIGYSGIYKTGRQDEGRIELKEIGDKWTSLSVIEGLGGNMGYVEGSEKLFSVEEYKLDGSPANTLKPLLANYYSMKEASLSNHMLPGIKAIKGKKNYYDLIVRTVDDETVKTKTYRYSSECEQYLKRDH